MTREYDTEIPGPLAESAARLYHALQERRGYHVRFAQASLQRLKAPDIWIRRVGEMQRLQPVATELDQLRSYKQYRDIFQQPMQSAFQQLGRNDDSTQHEFTLAWYGAEQVMRSVSERYFSVKSPGVASYSDWQNLIVRPRLKSVVSSYGETTAMNPLTYTQGEEYYYRYIRWRAYAAGISKAVLADLLFQESDYISPLETTELLQWVRSEHGLQFVDCMNAPALRMQATDTVEQQAHAFDFDEDFILHTHQQLPR